MEITVKAKIKYDFGYYSGYKAIKLKYAWKCGRFGSQKEGEIKIISNTIDGYMNTHMPDQIFFEKAYEELSMITADTMKKWIREDIENYLRAQSGTKTGYDKTDKLVKELNSKLSFKFDFEE